MTGQYVGDVFTVEDAAGGRYVLQNAYPSDRDTTPADRTGERRAVESAVIVYEDADAAGNGLGDGIFISKRRGVELTFYVEPPAPLPPLLGPGGAVMASPLGGRVGMARELARALAAVMACKALRFGPLSFAVDRAYVARRSPTARGYKVTAVFLGLDNGQEFTDADGAPVPLI